MRRLLLVLACLFIPTLAFGQTEKFANNPAGGNCTTLAGSLTAGATSTTIAANVACLPTLSGSDQFRILIGTEIIIVGARSGTTLSSLTRGAESTTAASHAAGDAVNHIVTAGPLGTNLTYQNLTLLTPTPVLLDDPDDWYIDDAPTATVRNGSLESNLRVTGRAGFGNVGYLEYDPSMKYQGNDLNTVLHLAEEVTDDSRLAYLEFGSLKMSVDTGGWGTELTVYTDPYSAANFAATLLSGAQYNVYHTTASALGQMYGASIQLSNFLAGGTVTNAKGVDVHFTTNNGTITTFKGFSVNKVAFGSQAATSYSFWTDLNSGANQWAFYGAGTANSLFGGNVEAASYTVGGTASTGSGGLVRATSPIIVTPTIASFTNATHDHTNSAGGGQLAVAALSDISTTYCALAGCTMTGAVTSTIGTITTNTPALTATQTWNASGVTFKPIFLNVTNTASAAASRLMDLQVGSSSQFSVTASGQVDILNAGVRARNVYIGYFGSSAVSILSDSGVYQLGSGNDIVLGRDAAATLQLGADVNGSAVAQTIKAHDGITGTDIAGANLTIAGGRGTGAGAVGNVILSTSTLLGSGTTAQSLTARLTITGTEFTSTLPWVFGAQYHQFSEMTAPSAAPANGARIYAEDTGGGKTRLCAIFPSGVPQCFAVEP